MLAEHSINQLNEKIGRKVSVLLTSARLRELACRYSKLAAANKPEETTPCDIIIAKHPIYPQWLAVKVADTAKAIWATEE